MGKIRLYIPQNLSEGQSITLDDSQSHYLCNVMKIATGDLLYCFDNMNGEYECKVTEAHKKHCELKILRKSNDYYQVPDVWLLFAPVKKDNTDFIIQKATELGVRKIIPVITDYSISNKIKKERFEANAIEASEQCRRTDIPKIEDAIKLNDLLHKWDSSRTLYFMDETLNGENVASVFSKSNIPCAILVGPEGGFSPEELSYLRKLPYAQAVSLGKRILRAETAVVAALSIWQALKGDWR